MSKDRLCRAIGFLLSAVVDIYMDFSFDIEVLVVSLMDVCFMFAPSGHVPSAVVVAHAWIICVPQGTNHVDPSLMSLMSFCFFESLSFDSSSFFRLMHACFYLWIWTTWIR